MQILWMIVLGSVLLITLPVLAVSTPSVPLVLSGRPGGLFVVVKGKPPIFQGFVSGVGFSECGFRLMSSYTHSVQNT